MNKKEFISFLMPIFNEELRIERAVMSIINQKTKYNFEIIIIDGMSTDKTRSIINRIKSNYSNIILIDNKKKIVPVGFNTGLSITKGDIIIRLDGHSVLDLDFIEKCLSSFKKVNADCVGGPILHIGDSFIGHLIKTAQESMFGNGGATFRMGISKGQYVNTLAFGAYKREVFKRIGGYDEELKRNQDDEFNFRLIQSGGKIWIDPSIKSRYHSRQSIFGLVKQYFEYGFFKVRVMQKRSSLSSIRHIIPALFSIITITTFLLSLFNINNILFLIFMGIYFSINISSCLFLIGFSPKKIVLLPFVFLFMHLSYGIGTIAGFIFFINKWSSKKTVDFSFDKKQFFKN